MFKPMTALAAFLTAAALVLPTVSQAKEFNSADDANSMVVSYADLNLAAKPAQLTLKRRIRRGGRGQLAIERDGLLKIAGERQHVGAVAQVGHR